MSKIEEILTIIGLEKLNENPACEEINEINPVSKFVKPEARIS